MKGLWLVAGPGVMQGDLIRLAELIDAERASHLEKEFGPRAIAVLLGTAFPPLTPHAGWQADGLERLAQRGWRAERRRAETLAELSASAPGGSEAQLSAFRRAVWLEKARIALRELLPVELGGAEFESTARELSLLADASLEVALAEAEEQVRARHGRPLRAEGGAARLVVLGMGKLGGLELNAGSDVDLIFVYDTDEGGSDVTLHEHWTRVVRRLVETLETPTPDGLVWRVDLRLRPEGSQGAVANSVDATERYYTTWGRLWERAALIRTRAAAGDLALGALLEREVFAPFVYRSEVDPTLAEALVELVERQRHELSIAPERDLKLGLGGIREAETFVQALQLVWGGREPSVRAKGTLAALARLQSRGFASNGEVHAISEGYALLRKLEHRVQWTSGLQTHLMPETTEDLDRLARTLRLRDASELERALARSRTAIHRLFEGLGPARSRATSPYAAVVAVLGDDAAAVERAVEPAFGGLEIGEHVVALARRPNGLLGAVTRERWPALGAAVLEELGASADAEQASRYLRSFFARFVSPEPYVSALAADRLALRRLVAAFASSAFIGDAVLARPELADLILFGNGAISDPSAALEMEIESQARRVDASDPEELTHALVSGLRIAKQRVMVEVAVADLAGTIGTRQATRLLSALADEELERALAHTMGYGANGLSVIAMGKLGGRDIGYGSDLDVIFVYDPSRAPSRDDAGSWFSTRAQRIIRLISEPHAAGPGYELDARLRPSGSQGMLVTSLEAFARYHGFSPDGSSRAASGPKVAQSGAGWERQALVRARFVAGDAELGARAITIAGRAAYETPPPTAEEVHRLRQRMEKELARESPRRFDLKVGRGGLLDVEFAVQLLQMRHGADPRVRTPDTPEALEALAAAGHVARPAYEAFREGYAFLRRLEQRLHVLRGRSASIIEPESPSVQPLARRMGYRDAPGAPATEALLARYRHVTESVRAAYLRVLGIR